MPGLCQFPGQVLGVPQPLVEPLRTQGAQQMCGVPGEEGPPDAPAPGQPVMQRVHARVQQFVRRGLAAAPAREGVPHPGDQGIGRDELAARRKQPVQPPCAVRQRPGGHLCAAAAPRRQPVQHGLAGPGQLGAQRGDGMPLHRRTPREPDVQELAHGGPGAVAADQITPAPPRRVGLPGVHRDTGRVLLQGIDPAERCHLHQFLPGDRVPQPAHECMLRQMDRGRQPITVRGVLAERQFAHQLLAPHGPPAGPPDALVPERRAPEPFHQRRGVLTQHHRPGGTCLVLPRILVEKYARDALRGEGERQHQADRPGTDDDHRVHGATPWARAVVRVVADVEASVRSAITERMQPTAGACVK